MEAQVNTTRRHVEIDITPEEAQAVVDWVQEVRRDGKMPSEVLQYLGPVYAVAGQREYGGH